MSDMSQHDDYISHDPAPNTISKSQLKKLKRREQWLATRGDRRKLEREKRKVKRRAQAEERDKLGHVSKPRFTSMAESSNKFKVVIDMNFEDFMTEAEIAKSVQQVGRIYALNRHSRNPFQLYITSVRGKILEKFSSTNTGYMNWDCNISDLDYIHLFQSPNNMSNISDSDQIVREKFLYLTADSANTLPDVDDILKDESRIFIIGGLVDHNRHKMLCQNRAEEHNIATARLPISKYVTLSQRSVLSTVTVYEIMLEVLGSHKQWSSALLDSIPKRKIVAPVMSDDKECSTTLNEKTT